LSGLRPHPSQFPRFWPPSHFLLSSASKLFSLLLRAPSRKMPPAEVDLVWIRALKEAPRLCKSITLSDTKTIRRRVRISLEDLPIRGPPGDPARSMSPYVATEPEVQARCFCHAVPSFLFSRLTPEVLVTPETDILIPPLISLKMRFTVPGS